MANIPLSLAYENGKQNLVNSVNQMLEMNVPMSMVEMALKEILAEVQVQVKLIYEQDMRDYQAAVAAEKEETESTEEQA